MSPYTKGMGTEARQSPVNIVGLYQGSNLRYHKITGIHSPQL